MHTNLHYKLGLSFLFGIGPKKAALLISKLGSPEAVFSADLKQLHQSTGISMAVISQINRTRALEIADKQLEYIAKNDITIHFYLDINYPRRLKQCDDAPLILYSKGHFDPNPSRTIAIVGTRSATEYGRGLCEELVKELAGNDIQVVSGMAFGIDICAHQLCLKLGIQTIGVLGHGLDRLYPRQHKRIAELMLDHGGLLTEFIPGTEPDRENFPMRNRIVAGMTDATIVIESKNTGGSLITAELANDYHRDVFAYPGNIGQIHSEGCNTLIRTNKAHLLANGAQFLKEMGWQNSVQGTAVVQKKCFGDLEEEELRICEFLDGSPGEHIDVICVGVKQPVSRLNVLLFQLEMKGIVKEFPGKRYSLN
ncbi:MAG: DNA-processing protein DprA [Flavobacteriia bacterium]|jgi:DNA processing protein